MKPFFKKKLRLRKTLTPRFSATGNTADRYFLADVVVFTLAPVPGISRRTWHQHLWFYIEFRIMPTSSKMSYKKLNSLLMIFMIIYK